MPTDAHQIQKKVTRGLAWVSAAQTVVSLLDVAAIFIVLRFWMSREEYGTQMAAYTLFPIFDVAADLGVSSSLIQRDDHSPSKLSTVFWFNVIQTSVLFGLLLVIGPLIGQLHGEAIIGTLIMVYGCKLLFQNVYAVPMSLMKRNLRFAELSAIRVVANLVEALVKIGLAWQGYVLWAFTLGAMSRVLVTGVLVQVLSPWRPSFTFKPREAIEFVKFGVRQSSSQLLFYTYTSLDYQIVGSYFGLAALGLYRAALELVLEPVRIISGVVTEVAFPAFARLRHDRKRLTEQFVSFMRMNLVTVLPFVALVYLAADDLIAVLIGEKWVAAALPARILCLVGLLRALSFMGPPLLDGVGKPQLTLRYMIIAAVTLTGLFLGCAEVLGPSLDYLSVAWAWALGYPVAFAVLAYMAMSELEITAREFWRRIRGIMACIAAGTGVAFGASSLTPSLGHGAHLAVVGGTLLLVTFLLLGYTQGINPNAIKRALKSS